MKYSFTALLILLIAIGFVAQSHDYYLLPESFFLHRGDHLDVHLFSGDKFQRDNEQKFQSSRTMKFMIYEGSKKTDLIAATKDSAAPVISYRVINGGLALIEMSRNDQPVEIDRSTFTDYVKEEGLSKIEEKVNAANEETFKEKYNRYLKTLVAVDGNGGNLYNKILGQDYEIILQQNPYKGNYGDDITGTVLFKGKPAKLANVDLYIKTESGAMFPQRMMSDNAGLIYFKLSREGIYMLRSIHTEASKSKDADFETWTTAFTFAFSNAGELPNSYKSFGFGNKH